jgi:hypothetical protein
MPTQNMTTSAISSLALSNATLPSYVLVIITSFILTIIVALLSNEYFMKKLLKVIDYFKKSLGLFFYGLISSAIFFASYWFVKLNLQQIDKGNPIILKIIFYPIIIYLSMVGLGWIIKKFIVDKIVANYKKATKKIQEKKNANTKK